MQMLRQLPTALLEHVCAMLLVREAASALALVARRSDVRVPWTRLAVGAESPLRYACLPRLAAFETTLQENSVAWIKSVLAAASSLQCLSLIVVGDSSLLHSIEGKVSVRELALSLAQAQVTSGEDLGQFLAAFPRVRKLTLAFSMFYADGCAKG
jgi:hypothetical protein